MIYFDFKIDFKIVSACAAVLLSKVFELFFLKYRTNISAKENQFDSIFPQNKFWFRKILTMQPFENAGPLTEFGVALIEA